MACWSAAGPPASSCFIRCSSSSTSVPPESRSSSAWMSSLCMPDWSSSAPEASSSSIAPARAWSWAVLSSARWIAMPTSPISSEMPEKASPILVCAWAAVYVALIVSFFVRKASTLAWSRWAARVSFSSSPWSVACWVSRSVTCCWRAARRDSASRARSSRPSASALRPWSSSVEDCLFSWASCSSRRLRLVATSATPRRTFWSSSSCFWYE